MIRLCRALLNKAMENIFKNRYLNNNKNPKCKNKSKFYLKDRKKNKI